MPTTLKIYRLYLADRSDGVQTPDPNMRIAEDAEVSSVEETGDVLELGEDVRFEVDDFFGPIFRLDQRGYDILRADIFGMTILLLNDFAEQREERPDDDPIDLYDPIEFPGV